MLAQHRIISPSLLLLVALVAVGGCSRTPRTGDNRAADKQDAAAIANAVRSMPANRSEASPITAVPRRFSGPVGTVSLAVPPDAKASRELTGRALMTQGWRLDWMGQPVDVGTPLVRLAITARPTERSGQVIEMLQVGASRDADSVRDCRYYGLAKPTDQSTAKRRINGLDWTVYQHRDAGMSQQIEAQDLRAVVDGTCWAVARISYAIKAAEAAADQRARSGQGCCCHGCSFNQLEGRRAGMSCVRRG